MNNSKNSNTKDEAILSSADGFTAFSFGGYNIRFRAPYSLERYVDVVKWDDGIPFVPGAPVRQVTDDGIEGMVRQHGHSLNAILHVYDVRS